MKHFLLIAVFGAFAGILHAQPQRSDNVEAELVAGVESLQPGKPFWMALRLKMDPQWHTYWINPGEAGLATELTWTDLPAGFEAGTFRWPAPKRYLQEDIMNYVYEGEVFLMFKMKPPKNLVPGQDVTFRARADWLECDPSQCVPGGADLTLTLPVKESKAEPSRWKTAFDKTEMAWPKESPSWEISALESGDTYTLTLEPQFQTHKEPQNIYFFSEAFQVVPSAEQKVTYASDGRILIELKKDLLADPNQKTLPGVLTASDDWIARSSLKALAINPEIKTTSNVDVAATTELPTEVAGPLGLGSLLGLAFLGGLILNLMPCVFPVLGLKIMGFVNQAGEEKGKIVLHGMVFTLGVLISFWLLAGLLLVLRAGGQELGWGFQLQSPGFVLALAVLLLLFGMNMSGVFEVGTGAVGVGSNLTGQSGLNGSFFSGVLATVVATPCAAPFLAPALGGALSLPAAQSILIFTAIGIGLSGPYLLLSAFPALVKLLPKPGAWMETFKQFMAFLLYATVAYLVWVLAGQVEANLLLGLLIGLVVIALGGWVYGRWAAPHKPSRTKWIARLIALVLVAAPLAYGYTGLAEQARQQAVLARAADGGAKPDFLVWQKWSPERVEKLRKEGRFVYIDFTARWCATCQVNKKSYNDPEVIEAFLANDVALLKADWTNNDPAITRALASYGRSAVPFNVLYSPGKADPIIMPEIFTASVVLEKLRQAGADKD